MVDAASAIAYDLNATIALGRAIDASIGGGTTSSTSSTTSRISPTSTSSNSSAGVEAVLEDGVDQESREASTTLFPIWGWDSGAMTTNADIMTQEPPAVSGPKTSERLAERQGPTILTGSQIIVLAATAVILAVLACWCYNRRA